MPLGTKMCVLADDLYKVLYFLYDCSVIVTLECHVEGQSRFLLHPIDGAGRERVYVGWRDWV